MSIYVPQFTLS